MKESLSSFKTSRNSISSHNLLALLFHKDLELIIIILHFIYRHRSGTQGILLCSHTVLKRVSSYCQLLWIKGSVKLM